MSEVRPWIRPDEVTIGGQNKCRIEIDELIDPDRPEITSGKQIRCKMPRRLFGGKRRAKGGDE